MYRKHMQQEYLILLNSFQKLVQMPKTSSEDRLAAVLEDLKEVLKHPHPKTPFLDKGTKQMMQLQN